MGSHGTFKRFADTSERKKGELKKVSDTKNVATIAISEEELLLINEQNKVNLVDNESTWVVDSGASFHLTPNLKCFSSVSM